MSWPYVAQNPGGGWYADCDGLQQDTDPDRSEVEALRWCVDRLAEKLGQERHGCARPGRVHCLLHKRLFTDEDITAIKQQMYVLGGPSTSPDWPTSTVIRAYEWWINNSLKETSTT